MSATKLLIVTDGLIAAGSGDQLHLGPHPALHVWQEQLNRCSQRWYGLKSAAPIEWYARLTGNDVALLLLHSINQDRLGGFAQLWIASPFHARLSRDRLHVMPDALLPWQESDADWLCDLLEPLFAEQGMQLIRHHASLLLLCREPLDASPLSFAAISGHTLPNRHPEGVDGGALMRLTAEIQMVLKQHPSDRRRAAGEADVDGLWLWGGSRIADATIADPGAIHSMAVATRNPMLRMLADAKGAEVMITEADHLAELVQSGQPLPKRVVLAGAGHAVLLKRSWLPKFGKGSWLARSVKDASGLFRLLREKQ